MRLFFFVIFLACNYFAISQKGNDFIINLALDTSIKFQTLRGLNFSNNNKNINEDVILLGIAKKELQPVFNYWLNYKKNNDSISFKSFKEYFNFCENFNISDTNRYPVTSIHNVLYYSLFVNEKKDIIIQLSVDSIFEKNNTNKIKIGNLLDSALKNSIYNFSPIKIELWNGSKKYEKEFEPKLKIDSLSLINITLDNLKQNIKAYYLDIANQTGLLKLKKETFKFIARLGNLNNKFDFNGRKRIQVIKNREFYNNKISMHKIQKGEEFSVGDTFILNNDYYSFSELDTFCNWIKINRLSSKKFVGFRENFYLPTLKFISYGLDSTSNLTSNLNDEKLKLLDFWGTWCIPCIKQMPELKLFLEKNPILEYYNILYDKPDKKGKAIEILKENNLPLNKTYFDDRTKFSENNESIIKKLDIGCYPGFMLINGKGKILYRGCGEEALKDIQKILDTNPK